MRFFFDERKGDISTRITGDMSEVENSITLSLDIFLILDEATSALDTELERLMQDALENLIKNRTSLVIAHRLSTVRNADLIYVFHEGQIAEEGTHDELIAANSRYKRRHEMQMFHCHPKVSDIINI